MSWKLPMGPVKSLRDTAHDRALRHEMTPEFPGLDMDAIYHRPEPENELDMIVREIHQLEAA